MRSPEEESRLGELSVAEDVPSRIPSQDTPETGSSPATTERNWFLEQWERLSQAGLAESVLRLGTHTLLLALILLVAWAMRQFYRLGETQEAQQDAALAAPLPTPTPTEPPPQLPLFDPQAMEASGIMRLAILDTSIPARPRTIVDKYIVEKGDTIFGIAEKFNLQPETILWGNQFALADNPHNLRPGQELNILPIDGTYYQWQAGDGLNGVSKFFGVKPEDIINYPGNQLNPDEIGDFAHPNIEAGTWLIVPGGRREFVTWSAPAIPRDNPGVAKVLGPGACGSVVDGAVGVGAFIWPSNNHFLSGFDYSPASNHPGVDIDGNTGDAVYAADNGVVVYAGWNNWGYGYVVVLNHGNGWQTLYAHLSAYNVGCGQSVYQGTLIGAIGSTGNSSGSHLHYEMMYQGTKVNPWDYLP